jgi:hypothetical protein
LARKIAVIWVILTACFIGCQGPERIGTKGVSAAKRIDTPAGMIKYLNRQRLPALRTVEPWQNNYGPGLKLTTAHYEVYTTLLEPLMLSQVPGFLESAYRGYNNQLPEPIETTTKFTIYIFGERKQWERFTRSFAPSAARLLSKIKAGAYYMKGACVAYNIGRERTFSTLGHEGWHQFNKRHFQFRLPSWIDEGIAMHFEASRESEGLFYFEPDRNGYRLGALKETLSWPLSPTAKKVAADRNIPLTTRWNRTVGPELFRQYISGDDLAGIEEEYLRFCRKIVYHVRLRPR